MVFGILLDKTVTFIQLYATQHFQKPYSFHSIGDIVLIKLEKIKELILFVTVKSFPTYQNHSPIEFGIVPTSFVLDWKKNSPRKISF
jgi:hypothetical protein